MNDFTLLLPVFKSKDERTIECLTDVYEDIPFMKELISGLINDNLKDDQIKNKRILLKPNWVNHSAGKNDDLCLRTNDNFLLAALEVILGKKPSKVIIGDAPIQGCLWDKMITPAFRDKINNLSAHYAIPVELKDFRRRIFNPAKNNPVEERRPLDEYIIFDLGKRSFLEPISISGKNIFRVTNYNPDRLADVHTAGIHKYCITKELFEADVVISLPKIKTHQKAGITGALKNLVGVNGDKDFLPHHRLGGTGFGGDCYPGKNYLRLWSELSLDVANRNQGKLVYWIWIKISSILWRMTKHTKVHHISAAWYGNDTTWRMVLDLNKIAVFGKADGTIAEEPQRMVFSLCDGIIGGQGNGPLKPEPLPLGVICFSNHSAITDISMAILMGFDFQKIPLLKEAYNLFDNLKVNLKYNGKSISFAELHQYLMHVLPAPGWIEYMKS
ncbi:MAG: DUF362 domain-containing protein [Ignavibacteriaceae bacterium]|nr:DUF362 domain-containing protein [Ignavibacteriaceae bacterium]